MRSPQRSRPRTVIEAASAVLIAVAAAPALPIIIARPPALLPRRFFGQFRRCQSTRTHAVDGPAGGR